MCKTLALGLRHVGGGVALQNSPYILAFLPNQCLVFIGRRKLRQLHNFMLSVDFSGAYTSEMIAIARVGCQVLLTAASQNPTVVVSFTGKAEDEMSQKEKFEIAQTSSRVVTRDLRACITLRRLCCCIESGVDRHTRGGWYNKLCM